MKMNVYIETYGCAANQNDSEIMAGLLTRAGFNVVKNPDLADIAIINTCVVKETTEKRMISRIQKLYKKFKNRLIVAGCMPASEYKKLKEIANVSLIGPKSITKVVNVVKKVLEGKLVEELGSGEDKVCQPKIRKNKIINIVQICEGCASNCSFCLTKFARGNLHSYPIDSIVSEIEIAKKSGCKEIWLTAQDCGCYGFDIGVTLPELINEIISRVKGNYFIRIGMLNPLHAKRILPDLIEAYKNKNVFKFIHIPVQSGSDKILKSMKRGYSSEDFTEIVETFRKEIPDITIWTDIIVGFPGETEKDFNESIELIKKVRPDFTNVSRFSSMHGTEASKMKQIPSEIKKERSRKMSELVDKICLEQNKKWVGWSGSVIIDEYKPEKQNWIARNFAYKPIALKGNFRLGEFTKVKISNADKTHLTGFKIQ